MTRQARLISFCHGMESGPWGLKISHLAQLARTAGWEVESLDYQHSYNPEVRTEQLLKHRQQDAVSELILVGSSMGGYVATQAAAQLAPIGLFLMAPAFYMPSYPNEPPTSRAVTQVVHGWHDEIIPVDHSIRFAQSRSASLSIVDSDHGLSDQIKTLENLFACFLSQFEPQ